MIGQKRTSLKRQLTQLENCVASGRYDKVNFQMRLDRVTELFHAYEDLNDELAILDPTNSHLDEICEIRDRYYDIASKIKSMEVAEPSSAQVNETLGNTCLNSTLTETRRRTLKLPVADLPKFDGSLGKWLSYKNTFLTMIDGRTDITDLEKFIYLKNSLRGDALNKISVYNTSADNYKHAWRLLVGSYEKRRMLVSEHLDAIIDLGMANKIEASGLERLVDDVRQHLNMLQSLDVTPDSSMIIRFLERAMPSEIREKWEETLSLDTLPTLEEFYKFVNETTFRRLTLEKGAVRDNSETGAKRRSDRESRTVKTRKIGTGARALVTTTVRTCNYCNKQHFLYSCPEFGKLSVSQRWEVINRKRLCRNCLRSHNGKCRSSQCKHCGRLHHSLLHNFGERQSSSVQATTMPNTAKAAAEPGSA